METMFYLCDSKVIYIKICFTHKEIDSSTKKDHKIFLCSLVNQDNNKHLHVGLQEHFG